MSCIPDHESAVFADKVGDGADVMARTGAILDNLECHQCHIVIEIRRQLLRRDELPLLGV